MLEGFTRLLIWWWLMFLRNDYVPFCLKVWLMMLGFGQILVQHVSALHIFVADLCRNFTARSVCFGSS